MNKDRKSRVKKLLAKWRWVHMQYGCTMLSDGTYYAAHSGAMIQKYRAELHKLGGRERRK